MVSNSLAPTGIVETSNVTTPLPALSREGGASRFFGPLTAQPSPTAVPRPFCNVARSVDVAIQNEPAMRTRVDTDVKALADLRVAAAAALGCAAWIHPIELAAGAFSLACENRCELRPRSVVHLLGQAHARQTLDVEVFDSDRVELPDNRGGRLVVEVEADAAHAVALLGEQHDGVAAAPRPTLAPSHEALGCTERALRRFERPRIVDHRAVAECGERRDANIDTDASPGSWKRRVGYRVARESDVPMPVSTKSDGCLLDPSPYFAVKLDLDVADAGELDATRSKEPHTVVIDGVFERERAVSAVTLESGVAWSLSSLDAPEEPAEGPVEPGDRVLQEVRVDGGVFGTRIANARELAHLRVGADGRALASVGVAAMLERGVVELSQSDERLVHRGGLRSRRVQAIAVDAKHHSSMIGSWTSRKVFVRAETLGSVFLLT